MDLGFLRLIPGLFSAVLNGAGDEDTRVASLPKTGVSLRARCHIVNDALSLSVDIQCIEAWRAYFPSSAPGKEAGLPMSMSYGIY
jgi:hypothetical protein